VSSRPGAKRVVIVADADRNSRSAATFGEVYLDSGSPKPINLTAPQKPGKYVICVTVGGDPESVEEFEVTGSDSPQKPDDPWPPIAARCDEYLTKRRFRAVKGEEVIPGDCSCDFYIEDHLLQLGNQGNGQSELGEKLRVEIPELKDYPSQLGRLLTDRWEAAQRQALAVPDKETKKRIGSG